MDGGEYTIYITAFVSETTFNAAINYNTALSFQLTLVDPCESTLVNNIAAQPTLNRGPATTETSVKYGQSGTSPFTYIL